MGYLFSVGGVLVALVAAFVFGILFGRKNAKAVAAVVGVKDVLKK